VNSEEIATITLPAGTHELTIKPVSIEKGELMKLLELQLTQSK
jgi:alpha-L-fucosidase